MKTTLVKYAWLAAFLLNACGICTLPLAAATPNAAANATEKPKNPTPAAPVKAHEKMTPTEILNVIFDTLKSGDYVKAVPYVDMSMKNQLESLIRINNALDQKDIETVLRETAQLAGQKINEEKLQKMLKNLAKKNDADAFIQTVRNSMQIQRATLKKAKITVLSEKITDNTAIVTVKTDGIAAATAGRQEQTETFHFIKKAGKWYNVAPQDIPETKEPAKK